MRKETLVRKRQRMLCAIAGIGLAAAAPAGAAYTWDVNGSAPGIGGTGDWDATSPFWNDGTSATTWVDGNDAVFGGTNYTAGIVTLKTNVSLATLTMPSLSAQVSTIDLNGFNLTGSGGVSGL